MLLGSERTIANLPIKRAYFDQTEAPILVLSTSDLGEGFYENHSGGTVKNIDRLGLGIAGFFGIVQKLAPSFLPRLINETTMLGVFYEKPFSMTVPSLTPRDSFIQAGILFIP